jgi:predicted dehydrogenase
MATNEKADFGVGLIGYGLAGSCFHAPFIATTPGLRLVAIVTSHPDRQEQARRAHPRARIVAAVEELWTSGAVDLVVIASPNRTHVPLARAAIAAGKAVVVDKPIAATAGDARGLIEDARRHGTLLTVFQNRRWDGDFLTLQRLLADGQLGQPLRFESRFERWRPAVKQGWRERPAPEEAGGLLYDIGSHVIDQALQLFGPADDVYAELDRRREGTEVDDDVFVALTHRSGVRSHLWMSVMAAEPGPRFRLVGTGGTYTKAGLDVQEEALRRGARPDAAGWGEEPEDRWGRLTNQSGVRVVRTAPGGYQHFYAALADALRSRGPVPVDPVDAAATLEIIERSLALSSPGTAPPSRSCPS